MVAQRVADNLWGVGCVCGLVGVYSILFALAHRIDRHVETAPGVPAWKQRAASSRLWMFASSMIEKSTLSAWLVRMPGEPITAKEKLTVQGNVLFMELLVMALFLGQGANQGAAQVLVAVAVGLAVGFPYETLFLERLWMWAAKRSSLLDESHETKRGLEPRRRVKRLSERRASVGAGAEGGAAARSGGQLGGRNGAPAPPPPPARPAGGTVPVHAPPLERVRSMEQGEASKHRPSRPPPPGRGLTRSASALSLQTRGLTRSMTRSLSTVAVGKVDLSRSPVRYVRPVAVRVVDPPPSDAPPDGSATLMAAAASALATRPDFSVTMPEQALLAIQTEHGLLVGFFVTGVVRSEAKAALPVTNRPSILAELFGGRLRPDFHQEALVEEHIVLAEAVHQLPDVRFVQAEVVYRAEPRSHEDVLETYDVNIREDRRELVKMVTASYVRSPFADGHAIEVDEVVAEPNVATREALAAYHSAAQHRDRGVHAAAAGRRQDPTSSDVLARVRLTLFELQAATWWANKPKPWKRRLVWALNVVLMAVLALILLMFTLFGTASAEVSIRDPALWRDEIMVAWGYELVFKVLVLEPVMTLLTLLFDMLLSALPEAWRDWAFEVFIEPLVYRLRSLGGVCEVLFGAG